MFKQTAMLTFAISYAGLLSQAPATRPSFETFDVATIKAVASDAKSSRYITMQGNSRFVEKDYTLKGLIAAAYDLNPHVISGGPQWLDDEHFDIVAVTPGDVRPTRDEQMTMLRRLLRERFGLTLHREPRSSPSSY